MAIPDLQWYPWKFCQIKYELDINVFFICIDCHLKFAFSPFCWNFLELRHSILSICSRSATKCQENNVTKCQEKFVSKCPRMSATKLNGSSAVTYPESSANKCPKPLAVLYPASSATSSVHQPIFAKFVKAAIPMELLPHRFRIPTGAQQPAQYKLLNQPMVKQKT